MISHIQCLVVTYRNYQIHQGTRSKAKTNNKNKPTGNVDMKVIRHVYYNNMINMVERLVDSWRNSLESWDM